MYGQGVAYRAEAPPCTLKVTFDVSNGIDAERAAMLLALTRTREEEEAAKSVLSQVGDLKFAVTEIGGMSDVLRSKIAPQVVGASLSQGVIRKCSTDTHALLHAVIEAERGLLMDAPMSGSMSMKIAVVRQGIWIVVAIFGHSAFHVLTNHRRAGLGVMHVLKMGSMD
ncbi:MAG: HutP family protein [Firmicutes bacterium]|nr:HutP family protein [Bacillota bacterium]